MPVRMELGGKDMANSSVKCVVRHSGAKFELKWDGIVEKTSELLETIHDEMYAKALAARD